MFLFQTSANAQGFGTAAAGKTLSAQEFSKKVDQLYIRTEVSFRGVQRSLGELDFGDRLLNRNWLDLLSLGTMAGAIPTEKEADLYASAGRYQAAFKDFQKKYNALKDAIRGKDEAKVQPALSALSNSYFELAVSQAKLVQKLEEYDLKGFEYVMPALEKAMDAGMVVGLATGVGAVATLGRAALAATLKNFLASATKKAFAGAFAGSAFFTALNFGNEYYSFGQLSDAMKRMNTDQAGALDELAGILKSTKKMAGEDGARFDRLMLDVDVARAEIRQRLRNDPSYRLDAGRVAAYFGETFAQLVVFEMGFGFFRAAGKAAMPKAKAPEAIAKPAQEMQRMTRKEMGEAGGKGPQENEFVKKPEAKAPQGTEFASLVETYRAMPTKGLGETVMYERITMVPKEKLADFAKCMEQYERDYPDIDNPGKPVKSLNGLQDSFKAWQEQEANHGKDIADFMQRLSETRLPHELGCREGSLRDLLKVNFSAEYAEGVKAIRLYSTNASVFEITCTDGRHYIAKSGDNIQEAFAHEVYRLLGNEPGYRIVCSKDLAVMEILDAMTLEEFAASGMPGLDRKRLAPGSGTAERERFLSTLMKSMARQVAFVMDDTKSRNYMIRPDGEAVRIDFADFSFQKAENLISLDLNLRNMVLGMKGDAKEMALMKGAFAEEWMALQRAFAQNRGVIEKAYASNIWNWRAQYSANQNFGWEIGTDLGRFMVGNLEKNLSYPPEQAWNMFVGGTGLVK